MAPVVSSVTASPTKVNFHASTQGREIINLVALMCMVPYQFPGRQMGDVGRDPRLVGESGLFVMLIEPMACERSIGDHPEETDRKIRRNRN